METIENPNKYLAWRGNPGWNRFCKLGKDKFLSVRGDEKEIPQLKHLKPNVSLETILRQVCTEFGYSEEQIQRKGRKATRSHNCNLSCQRP